MRVKLIVIMGLVFLFGLLAAQPGLAAIYKYVDKSGLVTLVDDLQSVPEEYRASVKIVSGEASGESSSHPVHGDKPEGQAGSVPRDSEPAASSQKAAEAPGGRGSFGGKTLVSVIVAVSSVFLFVILGKFEAEHKKAVKVMRLVVLWGVSVYILYAHAGDAVHVVKKLGGGIESVQQQSEEKGKKAAEAVKAWSSLAEQAGQAPAEPAEAEKKE
jgi:hypothetical protein